MTTADIKKYLAALTGTPARNWSRWAKYHVGSPADEAGRPQPGGDPGRGMRFFESHPHLAGCTVRVFGAPSDQPMTAAAVFERDGQIVHVEDVSGRM